MSLLPVALSLLLSAPVPGRTDKPQPTSQGAAAVDKTLLLQLVNEVRQKGCQCGDTWYPPAPAVSWNSQLEQAALVHSNDMYARNYFSHTALDGSKAGSRLDAAGYRWKTYGENIALGYHNEKEVVKGWLQSPGHCKNMLGKAYREMAVARVGNYWTQVFATRLTP